MANITAVNNMGLPNNNTVVLMGHSYCRYNSDVDSTFGTATAPGTGGKTYSRGPFERTNQLLGAPFRCISNLGVDGLTSTQILSQIPTVISKNPGFVWLHMTTNDVFNSILPATTISNCKDVIYALASAGITVLFCGEFPRSSMDATHAGYLAKTLNYIKDYCAVTDGVIYLDGYGSFADVSSLANMYNGVPDSATMLNETGVYLHPNSFGARKVAYAYAQQLRPFIPLVRLSPFMGSDGNTNGDIQYVTSNPTMCGTTGTFGTGSSGTLPTSFYSQRVAGSITATCSIVSRATAAAVFASGNIFDDGKNGNVIKISLASSAASSDSVVISSTTPTNLASGSGAYQTVLEYGINPTSGTVSRFDTNVRDAAFAIHNQTNVIGDAGDYLGLSAKETGILASRRFYLRSYTPQTISYELYTGTSSGGTADIYIANAGMRLAQI